jgi:hypothetical protein
MPLSVSVSDEEMIRAVGEGTDTPFFEGVANGRERMGLTIR